MSDHKKPTSDELEQNLQTAAKELEKSKDEKETPEETEVNNEDDTEENTEETQEEIDYKKKFIESSREAQIISAKNKKLSEALEQARNQSDVPEEELRREYPEWDEMTDTEKRMAKKAAVLDKRFSSIDSVAQEFRNIDEWQKKVDSFVDDPKTLVSNPDLEGKIEDFKAFATKPTRRGVDFEDIVSAFLYHNSSSKKHNKGQMFETGSGGQKDSKPSNKKLSVEEGRKLRETDYNTWKDYLKSGKIADF